MGYPDRQRKLRHKSLLFACIAVIANVFGNVLLREGMQQAGPTLSFSPWVYLQLLQHPLVDAGIILLSIWLLSDLTLLSWADLSYVLPVTATGYAVTALVGWAALDETVTPLHWIAIGLITTGALIVGRTKPRTTGVSS